MSEVNQKDYAAILRTAEEQVEQAGTLENLLKRDHSYDAQPELGGVVWVVEDGEVYHVAGMRDGSIAAESLHHIDGEDHGSHPDVYALDHEIAAALLDEAGRDQDAAWHREQAARFWAEADQTPSSAAWQPEHRPTVDMGRVRGDA